MKEEKNSGKGNVFKNAGSAIGRFFQWIGADLKEIGVTFAKGDWKTRISYLIMGFGQLRQQAVCSRYRFFGYRSSIYFVYCKFWLQVSG